MTATQIPDRLDGDFDLFDGMARSKARRRRNWPRLGAAVALAIGSGALFVGLYSSAGSRRPVLAIARLIPADTTITAGDLRTVRVADVPGLAPIPAPDAAAVVGRRAAVALVPGSLLVAGDLASGPALPPGWSTVGLDLKTNQVPTNLVIGEPVMVVLTSPSGQPVSAAAAPNVLVDSARVLSIDPPSATSTDTVLTLAVPTELAAAVADAEAAGQVALIGLDSGAS